MPEIGSVWHSAALHMNVVIIQTPGFLVLFMTPDGKYGSVHVNDWEAHFTIVKSREEVLS